MRLHKLGLLFLVLGLALVSTVATGQSPTVLIDFEAPVLGAAPRAIFDPYQPHDLVTFTSAAATKGVEVVGLVKNNATSVCVEPADANQKFGSGRSNFSDGAIGYGTSALRATFTQPLAPPHTVAVDFQTGAGIPVRLRLLDAAGVEIAAVTDRATTSAGTCGLPGQPRAIKRLTISADQPVAAAVMDLGPETGHFVFTIDNFAFGPAADPAPDQPQSDLVLLGVDEPTPVRAGEPFTYTLQVTNIGPAATTAAVLTTMLPSGVTLLAVPSAQARCSVAEPMVTCTLAPLAVNTGVQVQFLLAAHAERTAKTVTLAAEVRAQACIDPEPGNNLAATTFPVTSARVVQDLQALYTFVERQPSVIHDLSGVGAPLDLTVQEPTHVQATLAGMQIVTPTLLLSTAAHKLRQAVMATGEVSLEVWVTPSAQRAAQTAQLLHLAGPEATVALALLQEPYGNQAAGLYTAQLFTTQTPTGSRLSATPADNATEPLHLVYTRSATGLARLYVNGTARATKAMGGDFTNWPPELWLQLGADRAGGQSWLGEYHLVAFYQRALTAVEIAQNYRSGPHGDGQNDDAQRDEDLFGFDYEVWIDPPTPLTHSPVKLGAVVHRQGGKTVVNDVGVRFFLGDPAHNGQYLGDAVLERLSPRSSAISSDITWSPSAEGINTLYVQIDPQNTVAEADETNNLLLRTVTVRAATSTPNADSLAPHVDDFAIDDNRGSTTSPAVTLAVTVSDPIPSAGLAGVAFVEYAYAPDAGAWQISQLSDWRKYSAPPALYEWQLQAMPGLKYVQAWAKDKAGNISLFPYTRYINYAPPTQQVDRQAVQIQRYPLQAGARLALRLTPLRGDPDLYVWPPDYQDGRPPWVSNLRSGVDVVNLTAPVAGIYQIEIYGYTAAEYQLQITQAAPVAAGDEGGIDPSKARFAQPWLRLDSAPSTSQALLRFAAQGYQTFLPVISQ